MKQRKNSRQVLQIASSVAIIVYCVDSLCGMLIHRLVAQLGASGGILSVVNILLTLLLPLALAGFVVTFLAEDADQPVKVFPLRSVAAYSVTCSALALLFCLLYIISFMAFPLSNGNLSFFLSPAGQSSFSLISTLFMMVAIFLLGFLPQKRMKILFRIDGIFIGLFPIGQIIYLLGTHRGGRMSMGLVYLSVIPLIGWYVYLIVISVVVLWKKRTQKSQPQGEELE